MPNFAPIIKVTPIKKMKRIYQCAIAFTCLIMASVAFNSCEWDTSEDADFPLYVTYTISADYRVHVGPDSLFMDIKQWIRANQKAYDVKVNYSTGDPSEFTTTDAAAISHYEDFVPKFKAYLEEVKAKLAAGKYMDAHEVSATFCTYAARVQGQNGTLRYEEFEFTYPEPAQ